VTIGEFVATGCGQSKKKAKHCAAKAILDKLLGAQNAGLTAPGQPTIPDLAQASNQQLKDIMPIAFYTNQLKMHQRQLHFVCTLMLIVNCLFF
jgi:hypothetical protein